MTKVCVHILDVYQLARLAISEDGSAHAMALTMTYPDVQGKVLRLRTSRFQHMTFQKRIVWLSDEHCFVICIVSSEKSKVHTCILEPRLKESYCILVVSLPYFYHCGGISIKCCNGDKTYRYCEVRLSEARNVLNITELPHSSINISKIRLLHHLNEIMANYQEQASFQPRTPPNLVPTPSPAYMSDFHPSIRSTSSSSSKPPFHYHASQHLDSVTERPRTPPASHAHPPTRYGQHSQLPISASVAVTKAKTSSLPTSHGIPAIWAIPIDQVGPYAVAKKIVDLNAEVQRNAQPDHVPLHSENEQTLKILHHYRVWSNPARLSIISLQISLYWNVLFELRTHWQGGLW